MTLSAEVRALIESNALAHLVTLNPDGSPQVALVWMGLDGDELVSGHLNPQQQKVRNIRRDPRVAVSFETARINDHGLQEHLVLQGEAYLTEGGAADLLQRLAHTYLGPDVKFPPIDDPPPGVISHIRVTKVGGVGF
jgi:PPOX class probable F420-dependent enzyme